MKVGVSRQIPNCLFNSLLDYCLKNGHQLLVVADSRIRTKKNESMFFRFLMSIESKFSRSKYSEVSPDLPICENIDELNALICWKDIIPQSTYKSGLKVFTFHIDNLRIDSPYSFFRFVYKKSNFKLAIKLNAETIFSFDCSAAKTYTRTREIALMKLSACMKKVLYCKHYSNYEFKEESQLPESSIDENIFSISLKAIVLLIRNVFHKIANKKKQPSKSHWDICFGDRKSLEDVISAPESLKLIKHDESRFWADPFLYKHRDCIYIFVEEFKYENKRGEIAVLKQSDSGDFIYQGIALKRNYHLSYPCIFEIDGIPFMIPESGAQKRADLFICNEFPFAWSFQKTLLSGYNFSDTTVFHHQGLYWIFTSASKDGFLHDEQLLLYYTDDLINGLISEHPCNPISVGRSCSRMAGGLFFFDGKLFRPAQDCSRIYGGGVKFMVIEKLSIDEYIETEFMQLKPFAEYKGTHTFNICDDLVIIDAY